MITAHTTTRVRHVVVRWVLSYRTYNEAYVAVRLMMVSWEERLQSDILCVESNTKLSTWWLLGARRYATKSTPASLVYGQQIWSITSRGLLQNSWNLLVLHRSAYQRCWHSLWMYCSDHSSSSIIRNSYCLCEGRTCVRPYLLMLFCSA